jgi:translation elongation factor EF-4
MVFASLYPVDSSDFAALVTAIDRLTLNDASVSVERESSSSLGFGLRCGFLGLLHMDVFNSRLQQEFAMPVSVRAMLPHNSLELSTPHSTSRRSLLLLLWCHIASQC